MCDAIHVGNRSLAILSAENEVLRHENAQLREAFSVLYRHVVQIMEAQRVAANANAKAARLLASLPVSPLKDAEIET